ncbi:MAG TPA: sigma-70 family RNA polymerase sigma factor [Candidatus Saccharimonadales bacterium]|nr:sigma-70 family RNA polymerase sigma factor [Candidatus Saccharimonadales bacterium]
MSEVTRTPDSFRHDSEVPPSSMPDSRTLGREALREVNSSLKREFETFIAPHVSLILGIARKSLSDPQDAEDILQEVLIKTWHVFEKGNRPKKGWFATVTRTTIIDSYRRESLRRPNTEAVDYTSYENQALHPSYSFEDTIRQEMLAGDDAFMQFLVDILRTQHISGEELLELVIEIANGSKVSEYAAAHNMPGGQARRHLYIARNQARKYEALIQAYLAGEDISSKTL